MKTVNEYKQSLINAIDVIQDSKRCLGCVGNCNECEYFLAIEKIENAVDKLGELVEKETPKKDSVQCSATTVFAEEVWKERQI